MIWLLNDFDLLAVLLHAASLSLEALLLGGVAFLLLVALPAEAGEEVLRVCRRGIGWAAASLFVVEWLSVGVAGALLTGGANLSWREALTASPLIAQMVASVFALLVWAASRRTGTSLRRPQTTVTLLLCGGGLLAAAVSLSHAAARLDDRAILLVLTAAHHLGTAAWLGAMPFLLLSLPRADTVPAAQRVVRRYSRMALVSASLLILAGVGMAWFYVGSMPALYGTAYGVMLLVKIALLLVILLLGGANWYVDRTLHTAPEPLLERLRRFAEVEVGLGFTVILAAASLTSQPPAVDLQADRLSLSEIVARYHPVIPRFHSPAFMELTPPTSMQEAIQRSQYTLASISDAKDIAWSEYNHHWAGLIVLVAGGFALLSRFRGFRWARFWPLSFAGLSVFILLRADSEAWPLGPRSFWQSFAAPDVLQHRLYALLILGFAAFECAVQAGKLRAAWAKLVFPVMCAAGAALLLTHNHSLGNIKEELLAELDHSSIAIFGALAGWARWLELRLPRHDRERHVVSYIWPVALMVAGLLLIDYREA